MSASSIFGQLKSALFGKLKWFAVIEAEEAKDLASARSRPPDPPLAPFDLSVLGADTPGQRLQVWFLHRFFVCYFGFARIFCPFPPLPRFWRAVCITRQADVLQVLNDKDAFNVPFGPEMRDLAGGKDFVLGIDGPKQTLQHELIKQTLDPGDAARLRQRSAEIAKALIDGSGGVIDVMSDLVTRVATEICGYYFGLEIDEPDEFAEWALSLSTLLFADPDGKPEVRALALNGATRIRAIIDRAIARSKSNPAGDTLVGRLVSLQRTQTGLTDDQIKAILVGMVVGFIPTTTLGAGRMLEELLRRPRQWEAAKRAARGGRRQDLTAILWEAARLNPALQPGQWRYTTKDAVIGRGWRRKKVTPGTVLLVATMSAVRDWSAYPWPDSFRTGRPVLADFIFGFGPHECLGTYLAMDQITEVFMALLAQPALRPVPGSAGGLAWVGPLPRRLDMSFEHARAPQTQSMITIFAPVETSASAKLLNDRIRAELGNPALESSPIGQRLAATGIVHFASIAAIDVGGQDQPWTHLHIDLNVDGPVDAALEAIEKHAGDLLGPIVRAALPGDAPLHQVLGRYALDLHQRPWGAIGVAFNGTKEFPVSDIERQAALADFSRKALAFYLKDRGALSGRVWSAFDFVRRLIKQDRDLSRQAMAPGGNQLASLLKDGAEFTDFLIRPSRRRPQFPEWVDPGPWTPLQQVQDFFTIPADGRMLAWALIGLGVLFTAINFLFLDKVYRGPLAGIVFDILPHHFAAFVKFIATEPERFARQLAALWDSSAGIGSSLPKLVVQFLAAAQAQFGHVLASLWDHLVQRAASVPRLIMQFLATLPQQLFTWFNQTVTFLAKLIISLVCGVVMEILLVGGAVVAFTVKLRSLEVADAPDDQTPSLAEAEASAKSENPPGYAQNHFMAVTKLKPGRFRKATLALALYGIRLMVLTRFREGFVLNMGTIHYAKWFRPPGTDTLIFVANYDGSWESYLEDFVMRAHAGQTAVWSNGIGFPRTELLINDGAQDGDRFKRWVRRQQQVAPFWYSRFPRLTTTQIRNNALIHYGLMRVRNDSGARAWLDCFGSMQRPDETIETDEVQSLVFTGLGGLPYAACVALTVPQAPQHRRTWLSEIMRGHPKPSVEPICFGELPKGAEGRESAAFVAFSAAGLAKFGVPSAKGSDGLATFPGVFNMGMAQRERVLGDAETKAWPWSDGKADAVLFVYGRTSRKRDQALKKHLELLKGLGGQATYEVKTAPVGRSGADAFPKEHFDFRDGISQPVIRGTQRFALGCADRDVVEPGEFIFGYPNNLGYFAPSPTIAAERDIGRDLPVPLDCAQVPADAAAAATFPDFDALDAPYAARDFGRNGSFLVIRQLAQDVTGFDQFIARKAVEVASDYPSLSTQTGGAIDAEWIAAKLLGRWRSGVPLVDNAGPRPPAAPATAAQPDNDFSYGADDPQGLACPLGAHIRRANPRDSLAPGDPQEQEITNRHRLLRRGRSYVLPGDNGDEKGLLFVALCADLERQFEFVQQTWLNSPSFHGLVGESDPIAAQGGGTGGDFTIPTPSGPVVLRGMQSFVTAKAGGYFFLPSRSALRFMGG